MKAPLFSIQSTSLDSNGNGSIRLAPAGTRWLINTLHMSTGRRSNFQATFMFSFINRSNPLTPARVEAWRSDLGHVTTTQITNDSRYYTWFPIQSPDGSKLLFLRTSTSVAFGSYVDYSKASLWISDIDGDNATLLVPTAQLGYCESPSWSPDGKYIIFGSGAGVITLVDVTTKLVSYVTVTGIASGIHYPIYSNSGALIAFTRGDDIYTVAASGGAATQWTVNGGVQPHYSPMFSSDDTQIWYRTRFSTLPLNYGHQYVTIAGGAITTVLNDGYVNQRPIYCSDGNIRYARLVTGDTYKSLAVYNPLAAFPDRITNGTTADYNDIDYAEPPINPREANGYIRRWYADGPLLQTTDTATSGFTTDSTFSILLMDGEALYVVWTDGEPGATATVTIQGVYDVTPSRRGFRAL